MRRLVALAVLLPVLAVAAPKPCGTTLDFAAPGPYAVSQRTITFVDTSRATPPNGTFPGAPSRTLVTEVWAPGSATGAFPLVVHSHGFLDVRLGEEYALEHLASHGYVVASIDYPLSRGGAPGGSTIDDVQNQPGDARFVIDQLLARAATPGDPLAGRIDAAHIGASGLSLGGLTTLLLTYHRDLRDPRIDAAVSMAAPSCFFTRRFFRPAATPLLVLHGTTDALVPLRENGQRAYRNARGRKHLVTFTNGSHTGFTGFASAFDQTQHFDRIGCAGLLGGLGGALEDGTAFEALVNKKAGVSPDTNRCPLPCTETPVDPSMGAPRHHELTRTIVTAFFDAYLKDDAAARCYLGRRLEAEQSDTAVRSR